MRKTLEYIVSSGVMRTVSWLAALVLGAVAVWHGSLNQDEGWYLYAAQNVKDGFMPYRDFFFTQGPTMPFVYSWLAPLWMDKGSPLFGIAGARILTLAIGLLGVLVLCAAARRIVPQDRRNAVAVAVFALTACNLYHLYFITIPKTYSLGSLFLYAGFLALVAALEPDRKKLSAGLLCCAAGFSMALSTGTRISLVLALGASGLCLLCAFRRCRWLFFWFGIGGVAGLALTYGPFIVDKSSLAGLLAAQDYHAARGGFDPFFAAGSVSRLVRYYPGIIAATAIALVFATARRSCSANAADVRSGLARENGWWRIAVAAIGFSFAAIFLLQLSAPFPYDDYQVPVMGLASVMAAVFLVRNAPSRIFAEASSAAVLLIAVMASFGSSMLQNWFVDSQDRFWSIKKECSDIARLRKAANEIEMLDPGGKTLFTQDLYLAVETGRKVPDGLEMGPFSYFPGLNGEPAKARKLHVHNTDSLSRLISSAPCRVAAFSGYCFAIAAPVCNEVPEEEQRTLWRLLKKNYDTVARIDRFGQNSTPLMILLRKDSSSAPPLKLPDGSSKSKAMDVAPEGVK